MPRAQIYHINQRQHIETKQFYNNVELRGHVMILAPLRLWLSLVEAAVNRSVKYVNDMYDHSVKK